jgi:predicted TIM-barrel fold metal-dependent hydrolase
MEADGVDAEIIYGVLGTASKLNDTEASNEVLRIYNDWLRDFCSHYPNRQIGLACLRYGSVDLAVKEVHRVAKMGLKGLELSCSWDMEPMWAPELGTLLAGGRRGAIAAPPPHLSDNPAARPPGGAKGSSRGDCSGVSPFQMGLIHIIAGMMGAGVFERYPRLRVSFGESGAGWLAYMRCTAWISNSRTASAT